MNTTHQPQQRSARSLDHAARADTSHDRSPPSRPTRRLDLDEPVYRSSPCGSSRGGQAEVVPASPFRRTYRLLADARQRRLRAHLDHVAKSPRHAAPAIHQNLRTIGSIIDQLHLVGPRLELGAGSRSAPRRHHRYRTHCWRWRNRRFARSTTAHRSRADHHAEEELRHSRPARSRRPGRRARARRRHDGLAPVARPTAGRSSRVALRPGRSRMPSNEQIGDHRHPFREIQINTARPSPPDRVARQFSPHRRAPIFHTSTASTRRSCSVHRLRCLGSAPRRTPWSAIPAASSSTVRNTASRWNTRWSAREEQLRPVDVAHRAVAIDPLDNRWRLNQSIKALTITASRAARRTPPLDGRSVHRAAQICSTATLHRFRMSAPPRTLMEQFDGIVEGSSQPTTITCSPTTSSACARLVAIHPHRHCAVSTSITAATLFDTNVFRISTTAVPRRQHRRCPRRINRHRARPMRTITSPRRRGPRRWRAGDPHVRLRQQIAHLHSQSGLAQPPRR